MIAIGSAVCAWSRDRLDSVPRCSVSLPRHGCSCHTYKVIICKPAPLILVQAFQLQHIFLIFRRLTSEVRKYGSPIPSRRAKTPLSFVAILSFVPDFTLRKRDSIDSCEKGSRFRVGQRCGSNDCASNDWRSIPFGCGKGRHHWVRKSSPSLSTWLTSPGLLLSSTSWDMHLFLRWEPAFDNGALHNAVFMIHV